MEYNESKIKKAAIIREFRKQINGKSSDIIQALDVPFFRIANAIFQKKPHNVKFHITKTDDLVFNTIFSASEKIEAYIEHFNDGDVQMTLAHGDHAPDMIQGSLEYCLSVLNVFLKAKKYDSNSTNA